MASSFSFAAPRGMRDFYPEDMRLRNHIFDAWRAASVAAGFDPYDACVVESLELLERKAGEDIARQIYAFEDKSGRRLALRPEMTPSLARMVAARQSAWSFPLKWFTVAQCFRYERMTRGRKREHYQWNLDVIGEDSVSAEAEILCVAADALRRMGVPDEAYRVRLSNRALVSELLEALGIETAHHSAVFLALDKRGKVEDAEIRGFLAEQGMESDACDAAFSLLEIRTLADVERHVGASSNALADLHRLFDLLDACGIREQVVFDVAVVRGLAYYTGIVFEAFDTKGKFRAIFGGGRYDGLLSSIGGNPCTAVGLGFGDVVVGELLLDLLTPETMQPRSGLIVGYMTSGEQTVATRLAAHLRAGGDRVLLQLRPQKPKAFFGQAAASTASEAIFIGPDDRAAGRVRVKHLDSRTERELPIPGAQVSRV